MIQTVVFDVAETLVKEDRHWAGWADWLGVPRYTLDALVGVMVSRGGEGEDALRLLHPGMDVASARYAREQAGRGEYLDESDLYADVRPALGALRDMGKRVVIAGNQTARAGTLLRGLDLPADAVLTSGELGVAKPDPAFFARVVEEAGCAPHEAVYVGDLPAVDVFPARAAGMRAAHLRRGPWGHLWADDPEVVAAADWRADSLTRLAAAIAADDRAEEPDLPGQVCGAGGV